MSSDSRTYNVTITWFPEMQRSNQGWKLKHSFLTKKTSDHVVQRIGLTSQRSERMYNDVLLECSQSKMQREPSAFIVTVTYGFHRAWVQILPDFSCWIGHIKYSSLLFLQLCLGTVEGSLLEQVGASCEIMDKLLRRTDKVQDAELLNYFV